MEKHTKKILLFGGILFLLVGLLTGLFWGYWYVMLGGSLAILPKIIEAQEKGKSQEVLAQKTLEKERKKIEKRDKILQAKEFEKLWCDIQKAKEVRERKNPKEIRELVMTSLMKNEEEKEKDNGL